MKEADVPFCGLWQDETGKWHPLSDASREQRAKLLKCRKCKCLALAPSGRCFSCSAAQ